MKQACLFALALILMLFGCGEYEWNLCGEYRLVRMNADELRLVGPGNAIRVNGNVETYAVKAPYITGHTGLTDILDAKREPNIGYFIVNTSTDELVQGLSEDAWRGTLKRIGWENPKLIKPW